MKEKIIIDGVDVSECEQIFVQKKCALLDQVYCEDNPDCYYKQLKRLEEKYNKMVEISKENLIKYEDLRIDNQKLIMEIENLKSQIDFEAQKQAVLLQENEELKEFKKEVLKPVFLPNIEEKVTNTYHSALEEIREIANQTIIDYTEIAKNNKKLKALDLRNRMSEIQNIISEAIGE